MCKKTGNKDECRFQLVHKLSANNQSVTKLKMTTIMFFHSIKILALFKLNTIFAIERLQWIMRK